MKNSSLHAYFSSSSKRQKPNPSGKRLPSAFTIVSWNADSLLNRLKNAETRKEILAFLKSAGVDIFCVTEVRLAGGSDPGKPSDQGEGEVVRRALAEVDLENVWYSLFPGRKQSGVGIFSKSEILPRSVKFSLDDLSPRHHPEGRIIRCEFSEFELLLTYVPNNGWSEDAFARRRGWDESMEKWIKTRE